MRAPPNVTATRTARVALMVMFGAGNDPSVWTCASSLLHHWLLVDDDFVVNVPASISLADQSQGESTRTVITSTMRSMVRAWAGS